MKLPPFTLEPLNDEQHSHLLLHLRRRNAERGDRWRAKKGDLMHPDVR